MGVSSIVSSCEFRIYHVPQVALHEARGGRHDVVRDGVDSTPEATRWECLSVLVCECDYVERTKPGTIERKPSWKRVLRKVLDR